MNIYDFIKQKEMEFKSDIEVMPNWSWNFPEHVRTSMLFKHGKFKTADNTLETKNPNRNIVYPILNLRYRAEDIDVKDVVIYVNDDGKYHLSFLVKKYHDEVYVKTHDLDSFFDEAKEEKIDFGGTMVRKGKNGPIVEPLESVAFCDQTDMMTGPIGFKLFYSPEELYEMESSGWGKKENGATISVSSLIALGEASKQQTPDSEKNKTPEKYITVYRVHGSLPEKYLLDNESETYVRQIHVVGFYKNDKGIQQGVTLYRKKEFENPFKSHLGGKRIRNRALAFGGIEELFDPVIWTNYSEIRKRELLDAASKFLPWTDDPSIVNRQKIKDMDNFEWITVEKGSQVGTVRNGSPNVQLFNEWINEWNVQGQTTAFATDALLGKTPPSGMPFSLGNLTVQQGMGVHEYRRGKFATFIHEIYTDWIIPDIQKEIVNGTKFLAELSSDEMAYVSDCVATSQANKYIVGKILDGKIQRDNVEEIKMDVEAMKQSVKDDFARKGNKYFIEILKDEFRTTPLKVSINVAGKQKDMLEVVNKLTNVFRQVFANPAVLENPKAAKVFNKLIEYSGLDPIDFGYATYQTPNTPVPVNMPGQVPNQIQGGLANNAMA